MTRPRPFRFGLMGDTVRTPGELLETARKAEATGYATFLLRDHLAEEPFGHQLAPIPALAAVAAATTTLRIGSMVFANDFHHPALLAKEVATLDQLSGGRLEIGLGTGFYRAEYQQMGLPFEPPGVRFGRLAESLQIFKGLFAERPFSFAGEHYTITNVESFPKPVQRPHPPLLVGGGQRRILSLAAREADAIGVLTTSTATGVMLDDPLVRLPESVTQRIEWIRQAAGERFERIELSLFPTLIVTSDREAAASELAEQRGWSGLTPAQVLSMPALLAGSVERIVDEIQERRARYGFSYFVIGGRMIETAAPVVARLAGT